MGPVEAAQIAHARDVRMRLFGAPGLACAGDDASARRLAPPHGRGRKAQDRETVAALRPASPDRMDVSVIIATVCTYYGVRRADLLSVQRHRSVARPRQVAMYLCRIMTSLSCSGIGRRLGDRDHTTVGHALRSVSRLIESDPGFARDIAELKRRLGAA